jgi:hypothetical protein
MDELGRFFVVMVGLLVIVGLPLALLIGIGVSAGKKMYDKPNAGKPPPYDLPAEDSWE